MKSLKNLKLEEVPPILTHTKAAWYCVDVIQLYSLENINGTRYSSEDI